MNVMHEIKLIMPHGSSVVGVSAFCPHLKNKCSLTTYIIYFNSETVPMK